ncbi:hypothetical protein, partial [Escherichia coli]|uniref:hypothetical protein n=1 Tax=Escherichia coli TaxID=562 RepID=UPI001B8CDCBA
LPFPNLLHHWVSPVMFWQETRKFSMHGATFPVNCVKFHQIFVVNWSPECVLLSALAYLMGQ